MSFSATFLTDEETAIEGTDDLSNVVSSVTEAMIREENRRTSYYVADDDDEEVAGDEEKDALSSKTYPHIPFRDLFQLFLLALWFSVTVLCISQHKTAGPYGAAEMLTSSRLTTLPIAATDLGGVILSLPIALVARAFGWRRTLAIAGGIGFAASAICSVGLRFKILPLYLFGSFALAGMNVAGYLVRFAAAECVRFKNKDKIISVVLVGSAITGSFGPQIVRLGESIGPHYSGVYLVTAVLALMNVVVALLLRTKSPEKVRTKECDAAGYAAAPSDDDNDDDIIGGTVSRMGLCAALRTPQIVVGICCAASAMYNMLLVMSATPGAMRGTYSRYNYGMSETVTTIQLHIVAMFVPGLVTGDIMRRIGRPAAILIGALLNYSAIAVGMLSTSFASFIVCLILVGLGWNLTYIGGTRLLMDGYSQIGSSASQIKKLQGLNESIAQGAATVGALLAGFVLDIGDGRWSLVMWWALPSVVFANASVFGLLLYSTVHGER